MKKLLFAVLALSVHTTVYALDQGDYGSGFRSHGYNSLEQQQDAQHDIANMQRIQALNELQQARQQLKNDALDAERFLDAQRQYELTLGD